MGTLVWCWAVMTLEGFDIVAYGAAAPALLRYEPWQLSRQQVGLLGSLTLAGMLIGALLGGPAADRRGRRLVIIAGVLVFSAGALISAAAPVVPVFGAGRVLVGLGTGFALPAVAALVADEAPARRRNRHQGLVFVGIGCGGLASAAVALALGPGTGFRALFLTGAVPGLLLAPPLWRRLPATAPATRTEGAGTWALLVSRPYAARTTLFWVATACSLLVLFGCYTWLPVLMNQAGHAVGTAVSYLLTLNAGVIVGALVTTRLADRFGARVTTFASFSVAAAGFLVVAAGLPLAAGHLVVALIGASGITGQFLLNALITTGYPASHRAVALGAALGVGRIGGVLGPSYGAFLLGASSAPVTGFIGFAAPALAAGALTVLLPRSEPRRPGNAG